MWKFYRISFVIILALGGAGNHQAKGACSACPLIVQACQDECIKRFTRDKTKDCTAICNAGGKFCLLSEEEIKEKSKSLPPKE